jgi:GAF domain-containing protein
MNTLQNMTPETTPAAPGSFRERARATWLKISAAVVSAHPSITEVGTRQRAQLQATFSIIVVIMFAIGAVASLASRGIISANEYVLIFLAALGLAAYFISRTRSFGIGGHLLTGGVVVAAFAFLFTGQGSASALDSFIPLSMVLGSLLLSPGGLIFWISLSVTAIFFIPPEFGINVGTVTGNYITLGALLTVSVIFRNTIERSRLGELRTINASLRELQVGLEERVAERTRNLELAARVGRTVSQVRSLDIMLRDACELILKEFDLYYAQVYLTNPRQTALQLQAGTGEVGAQLRQRGHSLQFDTSSINGRAAIEKHAVVIPNTAESSTFRSNPLLPETRSEMAVPLIVADNVVGVLDIQSSQPGTLTEDVLPAFEALAGQLAVAIQNANLLKETEQTRAEVEAQARRLVRTAWAEHLDAIHKPEQIGFVFDRQEITPLADVDKSQLPEDTQAITAPIGITGEALGSLVVEIDDETQRVQTVELVNIVARQVAQQIESLRLLESAERYRFEAEQAARRQTREGWQKYIESRTGDHLGYLYDLQEVRPYNNGHEDGSALTLPLKAGDETVGKLSVLGLASNDQETIELANTVADRLGAHIENLRLFEETRQGQFELDKRASQLAAVAEISTASSRELDVDKMLQTVVNLTQRQFGLYHAHIFTFNEATQELRIAACGWQEGNPNEGSNETASIPLGQEKSLVARSARTRLAVIVNDVKSEPGWLPNPMLPETASEMAVPLVIGDQVLGVLDIQSDRINAFTEEDANIQTTLASQIATAMQNARSFSQAQKQAERETMLNAINQKIQSATSVEAVLQIAARELGHALGAPMTIAQLSLKEQN